MRETVPDVVLRDADDIVLVDITAEELIQRLKDGKVYLPETAKLAQQKFFTLRNLTALRELALRRTAARVDDQMVEQLRQNAIQGPWETTERLLVCVGPDERSLDVVRAAARLATGLNAEWVAVTVERPEAEVEGRSARADEALNLAQQPGRRSRAAARPRRRRGDSGLRAARELHVDPRRSLAAQPLAAVCSAARLSDALLRRAELIDVQVVTGDASVARASASDWRPRWMPGAALDAPKDLLAAAGGRRGRRRCWARR